MKNFLTRPSPPATLQQLFILLLLKSFETIFNTKISLKIVPSYTLEATRRRRRTHFFSFSKNQNLENFMQNHEKQNL